MFLSSCMLLANTATRTSSCISKRDMCWWMKERITLTLFLVCATCTFILFILYGLSDSRKSLKRVFKKSLCHPNLTMVIDDNMDVWHDKDWRRVHNLPAYNPLVSPEDKVIDCIWMHPYLDLSENRSGLVLHVACILTDQGVHGRGVLHILRDIISRKHRGFFRFIYKNTIQHSLPTQYCIYFDGVYI